MNEKHDIGVSIHIGENLDCIALRNIEGIHKHCRAHAQMGTTVISFGVQVYFSVHHLAR